ncbi:MAG: prolyl-tRNA synthetase associated domain-containing protein [Firmicutes bacterium]|nr:prolyl-tRNA synthetase associated domain-containing protein [Bacillota bacterium]
MNKEELFAFLDERGVAYERVDHSPVFTVDDMIDAEIPYEDVIAKNLFIRDDKKRNFYLITVLEDKRVDLKEFRHAHETRPLSFASEELLMDKMQLIRGAVTPFGLLNNDERDIKFYLDKDFVAKGKIGIHPNFNDATVFLETENLLEIIREHGNEIEIIEL